MSTRKIIEYLFNQGEGTIILSTKVRVRIAESIIDQQRLLVPGR